ncbi:MAG: hypothetical protein K6E29_04175 [Cyanobacteria bacterium RUI128]|nr:hypothetical protein [Cyanobacteria bacterium RUI128]
MDNFIKLKNKNINAEGYCKNELYVYINKDKICSINEDYVMDATRIELDNQRVFYVEEQIADILKG